MQKSDSHTRGTMGLFGDSKAAKKLKAEEKEALAQLKAEKKASLAAVKQDKGETIAKAKRLKGRLPTGIKNSGNELMNIAAEAQVCGRERSLCGWVWVVEWVWG